MLIQHCTVSFHDDVGRSELGVAFVPWPDSSQFVGFLRADAIEADDNRFCEGTVSIEIGLHGMEQGIFADAIERVSFDGSRVHVELKGPLSGALDIEIARELVDVARLGAMLELLFESTGRYSGRPGTGAAS